MLHNRIFALSVILATALSLSWSNPDTGVSQFTASAVAKESAPEPEGPYVELPKEKKVRANRYFCLRPKTNCKAVKWIIPDGLEKLDPEIPIKDSNAMVLIGDDGTYKVQAYGALADQVSDIATCTVTVGSPAPPTPPTPPTPPGPSDPLTATLQAAYAQDKDADRAKSLAYLQQVYAGMAQQAPAWGVKTNADALAKIKGIVQAPSVGLNATQVVNLRTAIAADFAATFGTSGGTAIDLNKLVAELAKTANALKGVQ